MTKQDLQNIFRQPFNAEVWQGLLINLFGVTEIRHTPAKLEADNKKTAEGKLLGELNTSDRYAIGLFIFEVNESTKIEMNRVGLRSLVRSYTRYEYDAAITVYHNETHWRLSFICDLKGENTAPKRYTYVFGNSEESYSTAAARLMKLADARPTFDSIKDAFSVEKLSREFFKGYKTQYTKFIEHVGDTKPNRDYVKKMLGRLVFLQFLQKKGWMGVPATNNKWQGGDIQYTQNLVRRNNANDRLMSDVLEPLFFDTLNTKREDDIADPTLGDNIKIPYLNGGLFDKDALDKKDIDFPYCYFEGLMDFFSAYNFTIDENDPYDSEVGIDPEMLGHIFENLLEDNKDKGAFYTPKEIVQYMCRQSLIEYLQSKLGKHTEIATFINSADLGDRTDRHNYITNNAKEIERLLDEVKICDPAIGSGAFPMGILNEIFHAKMTLDLTLDRAEVKRYIIQNSIYGVDIEQGAVDIARLRFWLSLVVDENEPQPLPNLDYKIVCGNSLISTFEERPIDLHRDSGKNFIKINKAKKKLYQLQSEFYSLSGDEKHTKELAIKRCLLDIIDLQIGFKIESSNESQDTQQSLFENSTRQNKVVIDVNLRKQLQAFRDLQNRLLTPNATTEDLSKIHIPLFDWEIIFSDIFSANEKEKQGFDIVIGNPPYIQLQANGGELAEMYNNCGFETFARTGDIYSLFYEKGLQLLASGGVECFITSSKWMRAAYGEKTRAYFAQNNPLALIDLGTGIFESATVDTNILLIQKGENKNELKAATVKNKDLGNISFSTLTVNGGDIWTVLSPIEQSIKQKIDAVGTPLKDWDIEINYGIKTGYNEAFIITTEKRDEILNNCLDNKERARTEEIIKPVLRGRDIKRYSAQWAGLWLINTHNGIREKLPRIDVDELHAIKTHLDQYYPQLERRQDKGATPYNLRNCAYLEDLYKSKITYIEICDKSQFHYDNEGQYAIGNTAYMISSTTVCLRYILSLLNSKFVTYILNFITSRTGAGTNRWLKVYVEQLAIPLISIEQQQPFIDIVDQILSAKAAAPKADTSALEAQIDQMVYALYRLTEEEIAIIESR